MPHFAQRTCDFALQLAIARADKRIEQFVTLIHLVQIAYLACKQRLELIILRIPHPMCHIGYRQAHLAAVHQDRMYIDFVPVAVIFVIIAIVKEAERLHNTIPHKSSLGGFAQIVVARVKQRRYHRTWHILFKEAHPSQSSYLIFSA